MLRFSTLILALAVIGGCADTIEPEKSGEPFCLEECLSTEPESETPSEKDPPSTEPPVTEPEEPDPPTEPDPEPEPEPEPELLLAGTFVSGHLGYYDGCPERAWTEGDASSGRSADGVACQDPDDCPLPCDPATLVIRLTNDGEVPATDVHVSLIELYGDDGILRAELPHEETLVLDTAEPFDGTVEPGAEVMLRISFAGPLDAWSLLQPADGDTDFAQSHPGIIETTFSSEGHADLVVESTEIYPISDIDT